MEIATTVATLRTVAGVLKEAGKIDLYQQIIDLQQAALEAAAERAKLMTDSAMLTQENVQLRGELTTLRHERDKRDRLVFRQDVYWEKVGDDKWDGPFCPKCVDGLGKYMRMTDRSDGLTMCVGCDHWIHTPGYVRPRQQSSGYYEGGVPIDF
jgi:hypothetical protein